jgi:hypothetical protein
MLILGPATAIVVYQLIPKEQTQANMDLLDLLFGTYAAIRYLASVRCRLTPIIV